MVFVYGSNEAGRHGRGAALRARQAYGAETGKGIGLVGKSYGIPTKNENLRVLSVSKIEKYVKDFITFARENRGEVFYVTRIGTGLAGFSDKEMAGLFIGSPRNCRFDKEWEQFLGKDYIYFSGNI